MSARRPMLGMLVLLCGVVSCLGIGVSGASAAVSYEFLSQTVEVPEGSGAALPGPFSSPNSMTVDGNELYVADGSNQEYKLDKFNASSGAFVSQFPRYRRSLTYIRASP